MKKIVELLKNKKIVFIALAIIVIASFSCIFTVQIVRNIERKKREQQPLLTYEAIRSEDEDEDQQRNIAFHIAEQTSKGLHRVRRFAAIAAHLTGTGHQSSLPFC